MQDQSQATKRRLAAADIDNTTATGHATETRQELCGPGTALCARSKSGHETLL